MDQQAFKTKNPCIPPKSRSLGLERNMYVLEGPEIDLRCGNAFDDDDVSHVVRGMGNQGQADSRKRNSKNEDTKSRSKKMHDCTMPPLF